MSIAPPEPNASTPFQGLLGLNAALQRLLAREPWLGLLPAVVLIAVVMSLIQWATPNIIGVDGYYHIKIAEVMRRALVPAPIPFPWLQLTILNPASFTDHHLLFHVLLEPFTFGDLRVGGKFAAAAFGSIALIGAALLMRWQGVRWSLLWVLALLAASAPFLYRLSMTRRQSLVLLLLLVLIGLAFARRDRWALVVGFAFAWVFDGILLFVLVAGMLAIGRSIDERRIHWQLVALAALGTVLGLALNPYSPRSVTFALEHALPKLQPVGDFMIGVGNEWYPYALPTLARLNWLALALVVIGFVPLAFSLRFGRSWDGRVMSLALMAVFFTVLLFRSRRFVEYQPAFAVLFCAFAWSFQWPAAVREWVGNRVPTWGRVVAWGGCCALLGFLLVGTVREAQSSARTSRPVAFYAGAAHWLASNTPPGSRVFTTDWDDFPLLFFHNTHNTYLVGLDPTYMYQYDRDLYFTWRAITRGQREQPSELIASRFESRYVLTDLAHSAFLEAAQRDPQLVQVYRDATSAVFEVDRR